MGIFVDADNPVPQLGQAGRRDASDIPKADHGNRDARRWKNLKSRDHLRQYAMAEIRRWIVLLHCKLNRRMKILWISPFLLHPTQKGAQIRSLGTLAQLHRRHEVHFASMQLPGQEDGVARTAEYCTRCYRIPHSLPRRRSLQFVPQFLGSFVSPLPLTISRDRNPAMRRLLDRLCADASFDVIVCDFLSSAVNLPDPSRAVLFQHNVETIIWRRLSEQAPTALHRWYFAGQARRMEEFERRICSAARHVIAVSGIDAGRMKEMFGIERVSAVPTGTDVGYFRRPAGCPLVHDLVFVGSMDWIPNIDGVKWFVQEVMPLIRRKRPATSLVIAGRGPGPEIQALAGGNSGITVTGTVADIRPYLWESRVSVVPLRIGGGTRLKIYEAMAASAPVVSTSIGAEGLDYREGQDLLTADEPEDFARKCLQLLENEDRRSAQAAAAFEFVNSRYSWERVASDFERILSGARGAV